MVEEKRRGWSKDRRRRRGDALDSEVPSFGLHQDHLVEREREIANCARKPFIFLFNDLFLPGLYLYKVELFLSPPVIGHRGYSHGAYGFSNFNSLPLQNLHLAKLRINRFGGLARLHSLTLSWYFRFTS